MKEKRCMHFSTQTHAQNMGQDNNSLAENVHITTSGTLGQLLDRKEKKYMHFSTQHILKTCMHGTGQQLTK